MIYLYILNLTNNKTNKINNLNKSISKKNK